MASNLLIDYSGSLKSLSDRVLGNGLNFSYLPNPSGSVELSNCEFLISVHHWLDPKILSINDSVRAAGCSWLPIIIDSAAVYVGTIPPPSEVSACFRCWLARCAQLSFIGQSELDAWTNGSAQLTVVTASPFGDILDRATYNLVERNLALLDNGLPSDVLSSTFERISMTDGVYERVSVIPVSNCFCRVIL